MGTSIALAMAMGIDKQRILKAVLSEILKIAHGNEVATPDNVRSDDLEEMSEIDRVEYGQSLNGNSEFWKKLPQN